MRAQGCAGPVDPKGAAGACVAQRAKFAEKVNKPPLRVNVMHFELNGLNAFIIHIGPLESLRPPKVIMHGGKYSNS